MSTKFRVVMTLVLISLGVPVARAQHGHGDEKKGQEEHGKPVQFTMPTTYKAAVEEIEHRLQEIAELIEAKKLDQVHAEADVIQKVGKVLGQLAVKDGSGVPKEAVKDINLAGKDLAARFDAIDKAGDSGDLPGTKKAYEGMVAIAATLQKYAPKVYQCPMKCEGEKTYDKVGKCPKCGMDVEDVKSHLDHAAKHGGVFFMAPDQKHHLEGTLSASNEFRIYFYDEYTKPISADKFTADGKAWTQSGSVWMDGADQAKPFKMSVEPGKGFLTAKIDLTVKIPVGIKATIDFKNGQKPQGFDFEFKEPNMESSGEKHGEHGKGNGGY